MRSISKYVAAFAIATSTLGAVGTAFADDLTSGPSSQAPTGNPTTTTTAGPTDPTDPTEDPTDQSGTSARRDPNWCCG